MSFVKRIMLVLKSYATTTTDRMERIAEEEALREARALKEAQVEMAAERARSSSPAPRTPAPAPPAKHAPASDYRTLGLEPGAAIERVETAWRELAQRADPKRFPEGSDEEKSAARILGAINAAYERIREAENPTEARFGRLEL